MVLVGTAQRKGADRGFADRNSSGTADLAFDAKQAFCQRFTETTDPSLWAFDQLFDVIRVEILMGQAADNPTIFGLANIVGEHQAHGVQLKGPLQVLF